MVDVGPDWIVREISRLLVKNHRFIEVGRSLSRSRYLRRPPEPFTLRISNHNWSGDIRRYMRSQNPQVVANVDVLLMTATQLDDLSAFVDRLAVAYAHRCEGRRRSVSPPQDGARQA